MRKVLKVVQSLAIIALIVVVSATLTDTVSAFNLTIQDGVNAARGTNQPYDLFGAGGAITTIVNTLLFVVGGLAVVMMIIGGLRYVVSGGNASAISSAKNTILYAIVGLVIAFLAFAAINWVLGALMPGSGGGFTNV